MIFFQLNFATGRKAKKLPRRSVAKLQNFRFTAKLNSLLAVRQDNLAILRII
jgi:hypothetical protein